MNKYIKYFEYRKITPEYYSDYIIPKYLSQLLPDHHACILDIGCGFGQFLSALSMQGYVNAEGIDINQDAVDFCLERKLSVTLIDGIKIFCTRSKKRYEFIIMNHVLEHLPKADTIETLEAIKNNLLVQGGQLLVVVPNAQSHTGCYWAYEDFSHETLFTSGSLYYVLRAAGFVEVCFLDPDGLEGTRPVLRLIKKTLLLVYKTNLWFWNRVTGSYFHRPSPQIFTYELKAIAK